MLTIVYLNTLIEQICDLMIALSAVKSLSKILRAKWYELSLVGGGEMCGEEQPSEENF